MGYFISGIILLIGGGITLVLRQQRTIAQLRDMQATDTYTVAALEKLSAAIADELGQPGSLRQMVRWSR